MHSRFRSFDRSIAFDNGVHMGATHMFIVRQHMGCCGGRNESCERTFYVMPGQNVNTELRKAEGVVIGFYDLSQPKEANLDEEVMCAFP